jgi:hypothetical protein
MPKTKIAPLTLKRMFVRAAGLIMVTPALYAAAGVFTGKGAVYDNARP